jgi:uncharacterized membrane protein
MTSLTEIRFVRNDFNLENTINENNTLKKSNSVLKITLAVILLGVIGVLIANSFVKRLEEETKQRV